jgi:hypothetical protein
MADKKTETAMRTSVPAAPGAASTAPAKVTINVVKSNEWTDVPWLWVTAQRSEILQAERLERHLRDWFCWAVRLAGYQQAVDHLRGALSSLTDPFENLQRRGIEVEIVEGAEQ